MSEPAPEGGGGNVLTRKVGPLPMWGWMGIGLAAALAFYFLNAKKSGATTGTGTSQGTSSVNSPGGIDASLVPQFVNQTYVNPEPPDAPNITVNNQIPAPTTTPSAPGPPQAKTISGAPGSYTTHVGKNGAFAEWTSTGKYTLNTLAKSHGMTAQQLVAASESNQNNIPLQKYVKQGNFNAPLPSGVELFFPNANWGTLNKT